MIAASVIGMTVGAVIGAMTGVVIGAMTGVVVADVPVHRLIGPVAGLLVVVIIGAALASRAIGSIRAPFTDATHPMPRATPSPLARRLLFALAVALVAAVGGPLLVGVAVTAILLARRWGPVRARRRRRAANERALPEAMDLLVLSVRAGLTPYQAACDLAASRDPVIGDAFAEVVRRTERGQSFADALGALGERMGPMAIGLADVIATSDRHGLPLGPVLDQLTIETRATRRRLDQADARQLPVRLSFPLVLCTLPSFVLLAIAPAVIAALSSLGAPAW